MRSRQVLITVSLVVLIGMLAGCNLPVNPGANPTISFPTPNLTMTAIFGQPQQVSVPPTVTPENAGSPTEPAMVIPTQGPRVVPTETKQAPIFPTATQKPSAAPTNTAKPGASVSAAFLSTAPKIDGAWDDWKTTQFPLRAVVYGAKNWKNADDLEAAYRVGWDDTYLYLAVKVTDNTYVQNATGANIYKGDSIEILLNTDPNAGSSNNELTDKDFQLGISPGNPEVGKNTEAYLWLPSSKEGAQSKVQIGAVSMKGGYRIEAAIPWSIFGVTPTDGQQFGFALSVSDNDQAGKTVQEKMISSASGRVLDDPSTWGTLTLSK